MTVSRLTAMVAARWYVVLTGLAVTIALAWAAAGLVPLKYRAESSLLLLPPAPRGSAAAANPYLALAGFDAFADVVSRSMNDTNVVAALRHEGVADPVSTIRDVTTNGPVIVVSIVGTQEKTVSAELRTAVAAVPGVLAELQSKIHVAPRNRFGSEVIVHGARPSAVRGSQIRAVLVAVVAGLFGTALVLVVLDRRGRQRAAPAARRGARLSPRPPRPVHTSARPVSHPPAAGAAGPSLPDRIEPVPAADERTPAPTGRA